MMSTSDHEVRTTAGRFYEALNRTLGGNDPVPMLALWSHGAEVTALHPDGARDLGWRQVRLLVENWAKHVSGGRIALVAPQVQLLGDVAILTGWERGGLRINEEQIRVDARVTLVFHREDEDWKVVHHHVDAVPEVREITRRLAAQMGVAAEGYDTASWSIRYGFV
jgi:ketosteroid isomerase-like protein